MIIYDSNNKIRSKLFDVTEIATIKSMEAKATPMTSSVRAGQRRLRLENKLCAVKITPDDDLLDVLDRYANNPDKIPTLHYAVKMGDEVAVSILLKHGMDINKPSPQGRPLEIAFINQGNLSMAKLLINNGADLIPIRVELLTSAIKDFRAGNETRMNLLFEFGFNSSMIEPTIIENVIENNEIKTLAYLLKVGFHPNRLASTAIEKAVYRNFLDELKMLVSSGFKLKNLGIKGGEILFNAIRSNHSNLELIKFLISNDIYCEHDDRNKGPVGDINGEFVLGKENFSMLSSAVEKGDIELVQILIQKGLRADCNYPLHIRFMGKHANQNYCMNISTENFNPLFVAIRNKRPDIAELLIKNGASVSFRDFTSYSKVIDWQKQGFIQTVEGVFAALPPEIKLQGGEQNGSLLAIAIRNNDVTSLQILLNAGHPVNIADKTGKMPIKLAVESGNREVIALLLKHGADWDGV